ncbi:hypothetical protein D9613_006968 [Agrocybe pediades]|uniref:Uncharacterized protein n=1 Tax=Agrocybe pediades TaxID=84607 RepID=A0A8H4QGX2_9AGAR|nr:hypothetical protein D9613_006968 [Agrocybe pediades]
MSVLALTYAWPSPSSSIRETNAQRLAQGLPPNPPRFIQELLAKRAQKTPGRVDLGSRPSSVPHVKLSGKLQLRSPEDGSALGNVRNWPGGGTISGTNFLGSDGDLLVELKFNPAKPFKINILATVYSISASNHQRSANDYNRTQLFLPPSSLELVL